VASHAVGSAWPVAARPGRFRQWWLDQSVRAKGMIAIAVPLIALIATTGASLALQYQEHQVRTVSRVASAVVTWADQVLIDAINAETAVRGYAVTRDPAFLGPYHVALARIGADRQSLRAAAVIEGDSRQEQVAAATASQALSELAQLRSAIAAGASAPGLRPGLATGRATMDLLRGQIAGLTRGPVALMTVKRTSIDSLEKAIKLVDIAGLLLGILAGLAGVALFTSGISRRVTAAAANADRLGEGLSLEPAGHSGDELGQLAGSLVAAEGLLASRAAELMAARDEAVSATQAKNAFLSSTSHELRTPLNSVLGFTQLLEMSDLSDEDRDSVGRILGAGRHLLALINELIDIARIESGELSLSVEPVAVLPLIEEASSLMGPLAAERSIQIVHHCPYPTLAASADRQRFSQILVNLLSNAVKYNRRGGSITITCREEGAGQASVVISDTGPGLSADDLRRIFVPFERLGAEQTGIEGTGIGLPLARALAEAMGGHLDASSVAGEGSAFTITLPRAPDVAPVAAHRTPLGSPAPPQLETGTTIGDGTIIDVLYIEDNPANVEVVSRFLRGRPGIRLTTATSGRAGLECATRDVPDLLLLDLHLSDIHGEQVLKELRAEPVTAGIPVVVLSAEAAPRVIRRMLASGALAYLTKPLNLTELGGLLDSFTAPAPDHQARPAAQSARA
jgi:signal transduction histidine kinase/ActR/RegA family two-component response regulator